MIKQIYRGYDITYHDAPDQNGSCFVISQSGKELARQPTENLAYIWIDGEKRKQSAGK